MSKYFKVKTDYLKLDNSNENGASKVSEVRLFEAVDYIDAQEQAIKIIENEGLCGECEVDIQKISYDCCLFRSSESLEVLKDVKKSEEELNELEETYWYDTRITRVITDDKGVDKYQTTKYLVEGTDLEDSIERMREFLKDENEDYWWFTSIQETPIQEVILSNLIIQ